ncbi:MAG: helix-turn-helix domain-containing protein [Pseudonocardiaceae bacterium]
MSLEPPELVALRRALGAQLAAARRAAEIGQQQVARKTGYSRSTVAHAESGRQLLTREFWETADELLAADGALLAEYQRVHAAKQDHERRHREAELAEAYAAAQALRATTSTDPIHDISGLAGQDALANVAAAAGAVLAEGLAGPLVYLAFLSGAAQPVSAEWGDQLYEQLAKFLQEWANTVKRRKLLELLGWAATTVAASPMSSLNAEEQERLARAIVSPSRVDAQVIDHIETILQHCQRQDDALGPQAVLDTVLAQRQLVRTLLTGCPDLLRPRLLSVHSKMSSSAGHYFFDLDDDASALHYCDQARAAAQEAHNTELAVYALCNMSYFSSWHGKAHAGLDFAAAAQSLAGKTDDVSLKICVADRAGTAYAVDGQYKECMAAFDRAQAGLASGASQISPESPAYWYHEGLVASHQSDCLLRLRKPQEATVKASAGLQLFDNSFVGSLAHCTLRLGTAHLQSGEVEEAARVIGDGALLVTQAPSARRTKEIRTARAQMQPWQDTQAVQALDDQLAAMGFGA